MKKLLTLSSTTLASKCTHWTTIELDEEAPNNSSSLGDMLHEKIECSLLGKPVPKFLDSKLPGRQEVPKRFWGWFNWATDLGLFSNPKGSTVLVEQQIAYNVLTGNCRFLPRKDEKKKRDYSLAVPGDICGTLDYARIVPSALSGMQDVIVLDWKSYDWNGKKMWNRKFKHASSDLQIRSAAAILSRLFNVRNVYAGMIYIPPVDENGICKPFGDIIQISSDEIAEIFMQLDRCSVKDESPRPGEHCKEHWCDAGPKKQNVCGAWR